MYNLNYSTRREQFGNNDKMSSAPIAHLIIYYGIESFGNYFVILTVAKTFYHPVF